MRAVRSFDPCLPCGVHMYLGKGRVKKVVHTPTGHVLMAVAATATAGRAVPGARSRASSRSTTSRRASWPRSWSARCSSSTARGSSGSSSALDGGARGAATRLARDGVVASLLLIHGLYPVPLDERVEAALERVRPYMESHGGGVELLRLEDGVAHLRLHGSCDGCPASASTLELAIKQALDEAAPDLDGIEVEGVVEPSGRRRSRSRHGRAARSRASRRMDGAGRRREARGRRDDAGPGAASCRCRRERRRDAARLPDACAGCGAPLDRGELDGGLLTCPAAGGASSCRSRAGAVGEDLQLRRCRCSRRTARQGRGRVIERRARPRAAPPGQPERAWTGGPREPPAAPRSAATCARRRSRPTTATCSTSRSGGSSAPARPAARSSPATGRTGRPARGRSGSTASSSRTSCGRLPDPDRARVLLPRAAPPAASSPSTRARPARPSASSTSGPGRSSSAANPVLAGLEPDVEALIVNRLGGAPQHAIAPIDECYRLVGLVRVSWQGISGGPQSRPPWRASSPSCGRRRRDGASSTRRASCRRPRWTSRSSASAAAPNAAAPTLLFTLRAGEPTGREVYTVALSTLIHIDPGLRSHDDGDARAPRRPLRRARAAGRRRRRASSWAQVDVLVPSFTGTRRIRPCPCRAPTTSRSPRRSTSTRCPTARSRSASTSAGRSSTAARTAGCRSCWCRGSRRAFRMPVATWRGMIDRHYPSSGWIRLHEDTLRRLQLRKAERGPPTFDAAVAELLGGRGVIEELVDSLLYEGYALYPYTPGANKNATPTPFGIVYPAGYEHGVRPPPAQCLVRGEDPADRGRGALPAGERRAAPGGRAARRRRRARPAAAARARPRSRSRRWSPASTA